MARLYVPVVTIMVMMVTFAIAASPPCRFAPSYTDDELINNSQRQKQFMLDAMFWEVHLYTAIITRISCAADNHRWNDSYNIGSIPNT
jgi:hypothetical protein